MILQVGAPSLRSRGGGSWAQRYNPAMPSHLRRYDEPGHVHFLTVSCYRRLPFFNEPAMRNIVVHGMDESRRRLGFRWIGYVIMPEHVHWFCYPQLPGAETLIPISRILQSVKTSVGMRVKEALRTVWARRRTLGHPGLDRSATSPQTNKPIWTTRGIDVNLTEYQKLLQKLDYCHANPVKRGLAKRAKDWQWSSHRFYQFADASILAMDWDGSWPIV